MTRESVRLRCGATGVDIGGGWGLYVSAQDNDLGVDKIAPDREPWAEAPLPGANEVTAAALAVRAATADLRAERDALRAKVGRVEAIHRKSPESDIHGEPVCVVCGMRDAYPCATLRALGADA